MIVVVKGHAHQQDHRRSSARRLLFFRITGFHPVLLKKSNPIYCLPTDQLIESKDFNIFLE
jgi:hypothetical protein